MTTAAVVPMRDSAGSPPSCDHESRSWPACPLALVPSMPAQVAKNEISCRRRDPADPPGPRADSESTHAGRTRDRAIESSPRSFGWRADDGTGARRANLGESSRTEFWLTLGHAQRSPVPTRNSSPSRGRKAAIPLLRPAWGGPVPGPVARMAIATTPDAAWVDSEYTQVRHRGHGRPSSSSVLVALLTGSCPSLSRVGTGVSIVAFARYLFSG